MKKWIGLLLTIVHLPVMAATTEPGSALSHQQLLRVIAGLMLVLLIIAVLSWLLKRMQGVQFSAQGMSQVAGMVLGPKEKISLVKVGDCYLLLGVASGSVYLLRDFGTELPQGLDVENKASFAQLLKSAVGKSK